MRREITLTFIAAIILAASITAIVADEESDAYADYDVMYNGVGYDLSGVDAKVVYVSGVSNPSILEGFTRNGVEYTVTGIVSLTGDGEDANIRYVTIPSTVWSIEPDAFDGCLNLRSIDVSEDSSSFASDDGVLYNKDMSTLVRVPQSTTDEFVVREGVTEIEALGQPFDPEKHNAVMHIDDDSYGENVVAQVFQAGFEINGKVIRHAIVQVAN